MLLGFAASYQDIRTKKIRNNLLLGALCCYGALAAAGFADIAPFGAGMIAMNAAAGCVASALVWRSGVWPAGDAKLFMVFALIVPLRYYINSFLPYFPSFALLVNIFFIGFSILCVMAFVDATRMGLHFAPGGSGDARGAAAAIRSAVVKGFPRFIKSTLALVGIFISARIAADYVVALGGRFFSGFVFVQFFAAFMLYRQMQNFMSSRASAPLCIAVAGGGMFVKLLLSGWDFAALWVYLVFVLKIALVFMVGLNVLVKVFNFYIRAMHTYEVPVEHLSGGMLIDKEFWREKVKDAGGAEGKMRPEGLEDEQAAALRGALPEGSMVPVLKTYPFAPVIFAGVLLTMYLKQSIIHLVLAWYARRGV